MAVDLKKLYFLLALFLCSCQKKPALSPSADPLSAIEPPPMGATTYNDELKEELLLLDQILENREPQKIESVKKALMKGEPGLDDKLGKIFLAMPELVHKQDLSPNRKKWFKAKLFFIRRRFVEASSLMSEVIAKEPDFYEAINWQARAIFFLGNPDLAREKLESIIKKAGESSSHGLDALYLLGAISFESNDIDEKRINSGIKAWSRYLALASPTPEMKKEIEDGLVELKKRLLGEKTDSASKTLDPFIERTSYSPEKNSILRAFAKEELLLALELAERQLKKSYDVDLVTIKARILLKTGRVEDAIRLYGEITKNNKQYAPGFHYQGMAFMMKGQPKDAVSSWQQVLKIDSAYALAHKLDQRIAVAQKMVGH